jgi:nucleoside-diphosphate-sugar epimerase
VTAAVEHIRADISEAGVLEGATKNVDEIYHLAAATSGTADYYQRVTVGASERLFNAVSGNGGARVVFVSSAGVYDGGCLTSGTVIDEDSRLERVPAARGLYARTKLESELYAHQYLNHSTIKLTIVRPGLVYGPRSRNVLNGAALSVRGKLLITTGTPEKLLPLIYVGDLADILISIASSDAAIGRIYNVAHPRMPTTEQFVETYREISGDHRPTINIPISRLLPIFRLLDKLSDSIGRKSNYSYAGARLASCPIFSANKIRRELGLEPKIGFREGLNKTCGN